MTFYSTFIGINQYIEPEISELSCAVNDASALHALFSDSLPDFDGRILSNSEANYLNILEEIKRIFLKAGSEDIALFYFAGHGAAISNGKDVHSLIAYDTIYKSESHTLENAISMPELARYLGSSQAKAAIIILDCCHSGGALSEVIPSLETRSIGLENLNESSLAGINSLQGQGRIIICAARSDEVAYEWKGHGLLTRTLLDIFKSSDDGVDVGYLTDAINDKMRAEANRIGAVQTPCIVNSTVGGLKLPLLKPGIQYKKMFPDTSSVEVSSKISSLSGFGFPNELIAVWSERYSDRLLDLQRDAINQYRVLDGESLLTVAPTSSGKTFIGEMAAAKAVLDRKKAVFLLPFKALTNEKFDDFSLLYAEKLGYRIVRCTGDYSDNQNEVVRGQYDIALLTYEKFFGLVLSVPSLLNKIGLIVIDEIQFVSDRNRGINLELLLTKIIMARATGVQPQCVALSAVIGEVNSFDSWLGCRLQLSDRRPLPLIEGVLDRRGVYQYLDETGSEQFTQLLDPSDIRQRKNKPGSQDVLVPLVRKLVHEDQEQVVVFRNNRGSASGCANYLGAELALPPANLAISQLPDQDVSSASDSLRLSLNGGTAFHTSDLKKEERAVVENNFRAADSQIRALAATTTVAAGVNTPAATVIIAEHSFLGKEKQDYTIAEYKNMAGRAGRLGFTERGRSILLATSSQERSQLFRHYVQGTPEPLASVFNSDDIGTWILRLLGQVKHYSIKELPTLLANTYGGYLHNRDNPDWNLTIDRQLNHLLNELYQLDLVEVEEDIIKLTLTGMAASQSALSLSSVKTLIRAFKQLTSVSSPQLVACLQMIPETGWISIHKSRDADWVKDVVSMCGMQMAQVFQRLNVNDMADYHGRCKRTAIIHAWMSGLSISDIEQRFQINNYQGVVRPGDIAKWANVTRLYFQSAYDIAQLLLPGNTPDAETVERTLQSLEFGLPTEALGLLKLPTPLTRGEYLALYQASCSSCRDVSDLPAETLSKLVSAESMEFLSKHNLALAT